VPRDRDPFAQFERMRREMDALFGHAFDRRLTQRGGGFSPAVDVWYTSDPPRAWVRAELAGVDPGDVTLEIRGRELVLSGRRRMESGEQRAYQQLEIEHGAFRRVVALGVDVDPEAAIASYEDGMLMVELPLASPRPSRTVPVQTVRRDDEP
jgi:HSP20 family protein